MMRKLWDMFFLVPTAGAAATVGIAATHWAGSGGIPAAATSDASRGSLFGAVVGLSGIILAVLLAVLTIITSMDERPLMKALKARADNSYDRLVYAMLGPIVVAILVAALAIASIALSAVPDNQTQSTGAVILVSVTLGMMLANLVQGGYLAFLIVKMLTFKGRPTLLTPEDEPSQAVRTIAVEAPKLSSAAELQHAMP